MASIAPFSPKMAMDQTTRRRPKSARSYFVQARKTEHMYATLLRKVARQVGDLTRELYNPDEPSSAYAVQDALRRYSGIIDKWAESVARRMVTEVAARDRRSWTELSKDMGLNLRTELDEAPLGMVMRERLAEQVNLITSLPREAADRVHKLTMEGISQGRRASEIADEIFRTGEVTRSRANLIARTEVARTSMEMTKARAEAVGSEGYIWRTAHDSDVRPSHKRMDGRFVRWDDAPTLDGLKGHAGGLPNCRCYPEPVIPED